MKTCNPYEIELRCDHPERWRYNIELLCVTFDAQGEQVSYATTSSRVAEPGAALRCAPTGVEIATRLILTAPTAASAEVLLYAIPHSLPQDRTIDHTKPQLWTLTIRQGDRQIACESVTVNPWGGASVRLAIKA